jgi:solute carrier family 8 (sodium/calcium exchanger)
MADVCLGVLEGGCEPKICEVGGSGLMLPFGGDAEQEWPAWVRAPVYLILLIWLFLGVNVVSDIFMSAIEAITSRRQRVYSKEMKSYTTQFVWNPTVANLTLMALGSSAPEILLSVIELFANGMYEGKLGPSTIVGSAAFNLFVIIAVCIMTIDDGDLRRIKEMPVYITTAVWSLIAYLWIMVVLLGSSPNVVEVWEGVVTLLFMPLLVTMAWLADQGYFNFFGGGDDEEEQSLSAIVAEDMTKEELAQLQAKILKQYGENLTETQVAKIIAIEHSPPHSRAHYRVNAIRNLTGGRKVRTQKRTSVASAIRDGVQKMVSGSSSSKAAKVAPEEAVVGKPSDETAVTVAATDKSTSSAPKELENPNQAVVQFAVASYAVVENAGTREVTVTRTGLMDKTVTVFFKTREGTAKVESDYIHAEGTLTFAPNVETQSINIAIVDDNAFEADEEFYVDLSEPKVDGQADGAVLGKWSTVTVVIIDDDLPGVLSFPEEHVTFQEQVSDQVVQLTVNRADGCTGDVSCKYRLEDDSAQEGIDYEKHYEGEAGEIFFKNGELAATIEITIKGCGRYSRKEMFRVVLEEAQGGATFNAKTDGGKESCILSVFIESQGQEAMHRVDRLKQKLSRKWEKSRIGHSNWRDQFLDALYVGGKPEEEDKTGTTTNSTTSTELDDEAPGFTDYVMHVISLPWKLLFALIPPTDYCGGWLCFCTSLIMIAGVTAVIGDMAGLLGCVLTLPDEITAITLVALGTSLPDTFASMTAAKQDETADASVGNVTGSNSVNVFLGLGLNWTIGSLYWANKSEDAAWFKKYVCPDKFKSLIGANFLAQPSFIYQAGTLAFSVAVFTSCALAAMAMLYVRRVTIGGELGGPKNNKRISAGFLVFLWLLYVCLSSWYALDQRVTCGGRL